MAYKVIYDTNLKLMGRSGQFPEGTFVLLGILFLFVFIAFLFILSTRKRISKLESEFSLVKSSIKKVTFEVAKLSSKVSNIRPSVDVNLQSSFSKPPELTENELERVVSLMISKAPVKINKEKLKEMIVRNDLKALARALKMSTSEVEILLNLRRKGA
jgi:predicted nuclease with TOPRIM domain